ncbi:hypothetical protein L4X63_02825 [Geomonas sp. Red32]|uniref:hypothetical protein n=1 Tax=Geomonas sp. Red32 TaxID=2912856 RepID=UPI00202CD4E7|nr:hypothetical protein [Geomonas sp. Red32]MCM0080515.1 hypothetical protein [Geomonas sp. Red32]
MKGKIAVVMTALVLSAGCATTGEKVQEGTVAPAESVHQQEVKSSKEMVQSFVGAHENANQQTLAELGEIKKAARDIQGQLGEVKETTRQTQSDVAEVKATERQLLETAQRTLQAIEETSKRQGTGEITVFYPMGSATLVPNSLEFQRLVQYVDYLSREAKGRKVIFLSIGSASSLGNKKKNLSLAKKRSEAPLEVIDKYLVNVPHEFHKVYGTGDLYSPKGITWKEHQRYQNTRIIALFDTAQAPAVNQEAK